MQGTDADRYECRIAGSADCQHPKRRRSFLGTMGVIAMYHCEGCGGVLLWDVTRSGGSDTPDST